MRGLHGRGSGSAPLVAALAGVILGLSTLMACAGLRRAGHGGLAAAAADAVLLAAVVVTAAVTALAQPTRLHRARVPLRRPIPHAWWPAADAGPGLVVWAGLPVMAGAGAAVLLLR